MGNPTIITICLILLPMLAVRAQISPNFRLPTNTRPLSYDLRIDPDLSNMTFQGFLEIQISVVNDADTIVLHSKDLTILRLNLYNASGLIATNFSHDNITDFLYINVLNSVILPANYTYRLEIDYNAAIGTGNVGFYRAFHPNVYHNATVAMAVTHLEATNARRAFPCYDEAIYKAVFQINIMRYANQVTASNGRLKATTIFADRVMDSYEHTPVMSTYLVAFMISDYISISVVSQNNTYRTFGRPDLIDRGDGNYSLVVAPLAIEHMENFTGVEYPLTTMDQVPVPNEFYKIGAMENWGMVTYREKYLMHNPDLSTASEKQTVATIISHEFAHQWFGNLVTPEWWIYIWLNEGFATYFEQYITSLIEPTWGLMEQFITVNVQPAFNDDALEGTRPMRRPQVQTPDEIDGIYDTIVYEKAGSVIRMVENFIGAEAFRNGLNLYLNTWQFNNANPQYLYDSWQTAFNNVSNSVNLNLTNILLSWETQAGFPVVNAQRNYNNASVILSQERFFINRPTGNDTTRWSIPVNYLTQAQTFNTINWLTGDTLNMDLNNTTSNNWIILNNDRKGFYRVNYDTTNWNLITRHLQNGNFSRVGVENRAALVDDALNLARAGRLNYSIALELATFVAHESHFVPVYTFTSAYSHLDKMATGHNHHTQVRAFGIEILEAIYNRTGFAINTTADDHLTKLLKVNVNTWLCHFEHQACRVNSAALFNSWLSNATNVVQPDMQNFVYCNGVRGLTRDNWNTVLQRYTSSREDTEKGRLATALGCVRNNTIINDLLLMLIQENSAFTQTDKMNALTSVYTNNGADGVNQVLSFLTTNFALVNQRIGNAGRIISGVASRVTTNNQLTNLIGFVNANNATLTDTVGTAVARSAIDAAEFNLLWVNQTSPDLINYFQNRDSSAGTIMTSIMLVALCLILQVIR